MDSKMNIFRLNGEVINIGDWDYGINEEGTVTNPLPDGAVSSDEEVVTTDAGIFVVTEYKRLRESEYPAIAEQLDDIYHNGVAGWKASIKVIKDKYPKPI